MAKRQRQYEEWDARDGYSDAPADEAYDAAYDDDEQYAGAAAGDYQGDLYPEDEDRGLMLQQEQSLVGVSNTITTHGVPLLSYTGTMSRFYTTRKQRLSLGRFTCEVCGERIRFWAWETNNHQRTHDGCYERLAWTWTNLYAHQQALAARGQFE
ncbi:MAG TPA: hypothetical protein VKQ30_21230 [Ktedonobacterales bacterium]|nr:hypothetical protein [Ktedonobacterales bacterium]